MSFQPTFQTFLVPFVMIVLLVIAIPNYIPLRERETCPDVNLPAIAKAKKRWAKDHGMGEKAVPKIRDLLPYLKDGRMPECFAFGTYSLGAVGTCPSCSFSWHTSMFSNRWWKSRSAKRK